MTLTETVINPTAWSRRVEWDLLHGAAGLYRTTFADQTPPPELERFAKANWHDAELRAAVEFEERYAAACRDAIGQLSQAENRPHVVTITDDGLAVVAEADLNELADHERVLWQRGVSGGATSPAYASTMVVGSGLIPGTQDTSLTAPSNTTTIVSGGSSGTKLEELDYQGVGTTAAGVLNVFLDDATTKHLIDQVLLTAVTSSATAVAFRQVRQYQNLFVKNGWSLKVSQTVAGNVSLVKVTAFGADL